MSEQAESAALDGSADIAALRSAQAAAERSLREAVDSISEGLVVYDADDRLVTCNQRYKELYPQSADAIVPGARFEDIVRVGLARGEYPEAVGREEAWLAERLSRRREAVSRIEQRLANGRWVLITERRTSDGGIAGLRIDITNLKRAQAEAEAAQVRIADFADASTDWFWESDAPGNVTYLSDTFEKATGILVAKRIGALRRDLDRALDPDNPHWDAHLATVAAQQPFRDFVMRAELDGGVRYLSASGKPMFDAEGKFLGYRGTIRDVTEQIAAEAAHRELEAQLQHSQKLEALAHTRGRRCPRAEQRACAGSRPC